MLFMDKFVIKSKLHDWFLLSIVDGKRDGENLVVYSSDVVVDISPRERKCCLTVEKV